jgi:cytochrome c
MNFGHATSDFAQKISCCWTQSIVTLFEFCSSAEDAQCDKRHAVPSIRHIAVAPIGKASNQRFSADQPRRRPTMHDNTRTQILAICCGALGLLGVSTAAGAADSAATQLLTKYNCQACHTVDKKLVGPSFKEIAAKYAGDSTAPAKLAQKIKTGGSGVWGAIPMPPNNVPDADLKTLADWILAQK